MLMYGEGMFLGHNTVFVVQGFAASVEFLLEPKTGNGRLETLFHDAVTNHTTLFAQNLL